MTLTNLQIINIINGINTTKELVNNAFPIKFAWSFQKNVQVIDNIAKLINEKMQAIESKYMDDEHSQEITQQDEKGETVTSRVVKPEFAEQFVKEKTDFLALENEVEIKKHSVEELGDINISLGSINALEFMLED